MTTLTATKHTRRALLSGVAAWCLCATPGLALTPDGATAFVARLVADIDAVIAKGGTEAGMIRQFEALFIRYADVEIMAQYALGVDGRRASAAQKSAFSKAFAKYISQKYGRRFRQFIGGRIDIEGTRRIKPGYEVRTIAHLQGESPIEVIFLVSDKSGQGQFFNMFIEGVNLLLTERAEIGAMLDRRGGDIDQMIADLKTLG
jgi:phospholipid transport system substrate-binding protein